MEDYHRHDLSDAAWERLKGKLPGRRGMWGGIARDNKKFINGVFWILRTGAPGGIYRQNMRIGKTRAAVFVGGAIRGWEKLLETLSEEPELKWLTIDASRIKVHPHGTGAKGGNQEMGRTKGGLTRSYALPWTRMADPFETNLPPEQ